MFECSGDSKSSDVSMECSGNGSDVAKVRLGTIICCFIHMLTSNLAKDWLECGGDSKSSDVAMECSGEGNGSDVAKVRVENIIMLFTYYGDCYRIGWNVLKTATAVMWLCIVSHLMMRL